LRATYGDELTLTDLAAARGVERDTVSGYRSRGQMIGEDRKVGRTPVWYPLTAAVWLLTPPRQGARTDLQPGRRPGARADALGDHSADRSSRS
jgi:hypothetical protein